MQDPLKLESTLDTLLSEQDEPEHRPPRLPQPLPFLHLPLELEEEEDDDEEDEEDDEEELLPQIDSTA